MTAKKPVSREVLDRFEVKDPQTFNELSWRIKKQEEQRIRKELKEVAEELKEEVA